MRELTTTEIERFNLTGYIPALNAPMDAAQTRAVAASSPRSPRQKTRGFSGFSNKKSVSRLGRFRTA